MLGITYGGVIKSIHFFSQLTVQTRSLFLLVFLVGAAVYFALRYRAKDGRVSVTYGTASKRIAKLYGIDRHKTVERNKILLTIKQLEKQAELRRLLTEAATERLRCEKEIILSMNEVIRNLTNFIPEEREVSRDHPNLEKSRFNLEYMKMNQLYELAEYDRILSLKRTELIRNEANLLRVFVTLNSRNEAHRPSGLSKLSLFFMRISLKINESILKYQTQGK